LKINAIESSSNSLLKTIRGLQQRHTREKTGLFLIEGRKAVAEARDKRLSIKDIVVSRSYLQAEPDVVAARDIGAVSVVDDKLFKELATTTTPEGILAVAAVPRYQFADLFKGPGNPLIVIAHALQDPGNLGTIIRTSLAASAGGLVLTAGTVDAFNPKVVRSAMGALFSLPIVGDVPYAQAISELKSKGVRIVACDASASRRYFECDLRQPVALVLGNEGQGFTREDLELADELVSIPMNAQSESLNVAVAGAIVLFSAVQQRVT